MCIILLTTVVDSPVERDDEAAKRVKKSAVWAAKQVSKSNIKHAFWEVSRIMSECKWSRRVPSRVHHIDDVVGRYGIAWITNSHLHNINKVDVDSFCGEHVSDVSVGCNRFP